MVVVVTFTVHCSVLAIHVNWIALAPKTKINKNIRTRLSTKPIEPKLSNTRLNRRLFALCKYWRRVCAMATVARAATTNFQFPGAELVSDRFGCGRCCSCCSILFIIHHISTSRRRYSHTQLHTRVQSIQSVSNIFSPAHARPPPFVSAENDNFNVLGSGKMKSSADTMRAQCDLHESSPRRHEDRAKKRKQFVFLVWNALFISYGVCPPPAIKRLATAHSCVCELFS